MYEHCVPHVHDDPSYLLERLVIDKARSILGYIKLSLLNVLAELPMLATYQHTRFSLRPSFLLPHGRHTWRSSRLAIMSRLAVVVGV